jgi:hypothetical protein
VLRAAEIPRLRVGMTRAALRLRMTKPSRPGMTLACHPERTRGISALRAVEIPRLRLGMTMAALRLGRTKSDGCERQAVGRVDGDF